MSADAVVDENIFVHADVFYSLTNALADLANDRMLGVHVGEEFAFSDWPPFANSAADSTSLFEFLTRYIQMVPTEASSVQHRLVVEAGRATYQVTRTSDPGVAPTQVTGFGCAQYIRVIRAVTGQFWDPTKVSFKSKHLGGIPENYQDIEVAYSRDPGIQISYPVDWLFNALDLNIRVAKGRTSEPTHAVSVVTALRSVLRSNLQQDDLSPNAVAALLGLDAERLLKALKQNGTSLSKELKRLKIEQAKDALSTSKRKISEIGASLGYSDSAHFTRFFRSQTGFSPSEYRRRVDLQDR